MKDLYYFVNPINSSECYKLREDGHLFNYDFKTFKWLDVSLITQLTYGWKMITKDEMTDNILQSYQTTSKWYMDDIFEDEDEDDSLDLGDIFKYYKKGNRVVCVDNKGNQYDCKPGSYDLIPLNVVEEDWELLSTEDVLDAINLRHSALKLEDMTLYCDTLGNIRAENDEGKHFIVSLKTGYMNIDFSDFTTVDKSGWKKITMDYVNSLGDKIEKSIPYSSIPNLEDLNDYIINCKEDLSHLNNVELTDDIEFYISPFGSIFFRDQNNNEYSFRDDSVYLEDEGTIDLDTYKKLSLSEVIPLTTFSFNKSGTVSLYDLDLYKDEDDTIWGKNEDGELYYLDEEGYITSTVDPFNKKEKVSTLDAVIKQAHIVDVRHYITYLELCTKIHECPLNLFEDKIELYYRTEDGELNVFFYNEEKGLFIANVNQLIKVVEPKLDETFQKLEIDQFFVYFLESNKEDLTRHQVKDMLSKENGTFAHDLLEASRTSSLIAYEEMDNFDDPNDFDVDDFFDPDIPF